MQADEHRAAAAVTEFNRCLIVSLVDEMDDLELAECAISIYEQVERSAVRGVVFNFSMVQVLDSHEMELLHSMARALKLMGIEVVWVGLTTGVVIGLIDLGIEIDSVSIRTARTLEQGLHLLIVQEVL